MGRTVEWRPGAPDVSTPPHGLDPDVLIEQSLTLAPEPASAGQARRLVRQTLERADRDVWADAGELAVSEVVSNAVLHAHTSLTVRVVVRQDRLEVEVRDGSPALPQQRRYGVSATTGRGMVLVAALTTSCGVTSLGDEGKVVWFTISDAAAPDTADALLAAWGLDDARQAGPSSAVRSVVLSAMPATLWLAARQHHDALLRELALHQAEHGGAPVDLAAADAARQVISGTLQRALDEAGRAGRTRPALPDGHPSPLPWVPEQLDLELLVDPALGPAFGALQDALDTAERLAVAGRLLVRPGLPEVVAVRDWACDQVVAQLAGVAAAPWGGTAQEHFATAAPDGGAPVGLDEDALALRDSDRGVVAADDANRIVGISSRLAARLGWRPEDIVGRRVVALIPPHLREAHVAGFTRHLSTGESHVLGVELVLPMLRADGTELPCTFLIERRIRDGGRWTYLAWIEPVD
jgi:PAS domain S-box-containing protein